jgi:hypothetical protein
LRFFNIGWRNDFAVRWWSAFAIGWPIAASTAYLAIPFARSLTQRIVAAISSLRDGLTSCSPGVSHGTSHGRLKFSTQLILFYDQLYSKISFL